MLSLLVIPLKELQHQISMAKKFNFAITSYYGSTMALIDLPDELLLGVVDHITQSDMSAFTRTNKKLHDVSNRELYERDVRTGANKALFWAAERGSTTTLDLALATGANIEASAGYIGTPLQIACEFGQET